MDNNSSTNMLFHLLLLIVFNDSALDADTIFDRDKIRTIASVFVVIVVLFSSLSLFSVLLHLIVVVT